MRNPDFCLCENKGADQLRGNREADQRLCFRYTDSTIPLLSKSKISSLWPSSVTAQAGLCRTCSESTLLVFTRGGSNLILPETSEDQYLYRYTVFSIDLIPRFQDSTIAHLMICLQSIEEKNNISINFLCIEAINSISFVLNTNGHYFSIGYFFVNFQTIFDNRLFLRKFKQFSTNKLHFEIFTPFLTCLQKAYILFLGRGQIRGNRTASSFFE